MELRVRLGIRLKHHCETHDPELKSQTSGVQQMGIGPDPMIQTAGSNSRILI